MHALDILQGQFSVIAEHFAQCDVNFLSLVCRQAEGKIAGEILGKLQHGFSAGGGDSLHRRKTLPLHDRDIVGSGEIGGVFYPSGFPGIGGCKSCIHYLAVLEVGKADWAVVAPPPAFIGADCLHTPICMGQLQLCQQLALCTIGVGAAFGTAGAAIPAVCQFYG